MNRTVAYCFLIVFCGVSIVISISKPYLLSDKNTFLHGFVNQELLNILGVILAITLASTANIHLAFNRIEERFNRPNGLARSRTNLKKATYWLIGLFVVALGLVVMKPVVCNSETIQALFNSAALLVLLWHVLILVSLTQLVFRIEPDFSKSDQDDGT